VVVVVVVVAAPGAVARVLLVLPAHALA